VDGRRPRVAYTVAIELDAHGDPAGSRGALARGIACYETSPDHLAGRLERLWFSRLLLMAGRGDEALAVASVASQADTMDLTFLGLYRPAPISIPIRCSPR
jgi:hypothetical protein